ncbi:MAG: DUF4434 domain-containing protein [Ignavibacteriaceae bacterium]
MISTRNNQLNLYYFFIVSLLLIFVFYSPNTSAQTINVSVNHNRVSVGDTVKIKIEVKSDEKPSAVILIPQKGVIPLKLQSEKGSIYTSEFVVNKEDAQGLYIIHSWIGDSLKPSVIGKGSFLFKKIIGDFCMVGIFDPKNPDGDINNYLKQVKSFGGNFLIVHGIITSKEELGVSESKVYYASKICNTSTTSKVEQSYLENLLTHCDQEGIPVLLSASWDMTRDIPYPERTKSTKEIMQELYKLYGHHPSLAGFYAYQEAGGTYYLPFIREFCSYAKHLNKGLLTATAPYMDDPLLASYLSTVKDLDIIIYQSMVMASYRPDNRKKFPSRRVKDFGSVSSGAKKLQNKIALTHVELFGYGKNRLKNLYITGYDNIYQQILSAATVPENDGITLFTYSSVIYDLLKKHKEFEPSQQAVFDGLKAFQFIGEASEKSNQLSVYIPWDDWSIERWSCYYYDALDAFRTLGMPVDILPYAPPLKESYQPYYPYHENPDVLKRLLKNKKILVFPNISGFYQTDSDMIKHFIENGGTVIAFGPHIPMGTTYDRSLIFGIKKLGRDKTHSEIISKKSFSKSSSNNKKWELGKVKLPVWESTGGKVIAAFEDGSPAVVVNEYGKGKAVSILTDAKTAADKFPDLIRDVFDEIGAKRYVDIIGTNENTDVAVSQTGEGFTAAIVNHGSTKLNVTLKPLTNYSHQTSQKWIDLVSKETIKESKNNSPLKITVMPKSFRLIKMQN